MIGIDEVGRGCIAGPLLVVAARMTGQQPAGLTDSKKLSKSSRLLLYPCLVESYTFGEGWVSSAEIDRVGLAEAMRLGVARSLKGLSAGTDETVILDGSVNYLPSDFSAGSWHIGADAKVAAVSAASVYAKVTRDGYMMSLATKFPDYGFATHVGYGTPAHLEALSKHGPIPRVHRMSFRRVKELLL